jgi:hypothetical protein
MSWDQSAAVNSARIGIALLAILLFSLTLTSFSDDPILTTRLSGPAVAQGSISPAGLRALGHDDRYILHGPLDTAPSRAEVSQPVSPSDVQPVESSRVSGDKKKFLGGIFLYMLLRSQER